MVMMSQPASCRATSASRISSLVSPIPRIRLLLVTSCASRAAVITDRLRS
ncbi:Uncharacterised protein [Mycobacteroides abscessus subsp. abscessus]|nr:Uncharacterised protein [Mycobacteroides abscessus subsp. abscessus]